MINRRRLIACAGSFMTIDMREMRFCVVELFCFFRKRGVYKHVIRNAL